jgi:putative SbcD/Mre11-related phosphoesterase
MEPKFITGQPALIVGRTLVVSDLHIGIEHDFRRSGIKVPSSTETMRKSIEGMIENTGAKNLVIIGDVKHKVPGITMQELREVPEFLGALSKRVKIDIVPGNHDPGLDEMVPEGVTIQPSRGFMKNGVYFSHGHTWPLPEFLKAKYVIVGHEHPQIEFRDSLGHTFYESVWLRSELDEEIIKDKYKEIPEKLPELVTMPKFNRLSGSTSMNKPISEIDNSHYGDRGGIGVLIKSSRLDESRVYLLDGMFLGELKNLF